MSSTVDYCAACDATHPWYLVGGVLTVCGSVLVLCTWALYPSLRSHPSIYIVMRSGVALVLGLLLVVLFVVPVRVLACQTAVCAWLGAATLWTFLALQGYFACASLDLFLSLRNPFSVPEARTRRMHAAVLSLSTLTTLSLRWSSPSSFAYRHDVQLCFVGEGAAGDHGVRGVFLVAPTLGSMALSAASSVASWRRLKKGLPDTFAVRMRALLDGLFFALGFTAYWLFVGAFYLALFVRGSPSPPARAAFAVSFGGLGVVDALLWFVRKFRMKAADAHTQHALHELVVSKEPLPPDSAQLSAGKLGAPDERKSVHRRMSHRSGKSEGHSMNKALRREVLAYTTDGIAQSVDKAKALAKAVGDAALEQLEAVPGERYFPKSLRGDADGVALRRFGMHIQHNSELLYGAALKADGDADEERSSARRVRHGQQHSSSLAEYMNVLTASDGRAPSQSAADSAQERQLRKDREFTDYAPLVFRFVRRKLLQCSDAEYIASIIPSAARQQRDVLDAKYGEGVLCWISYII